MDILTGMMMGFIQWGGDVLSYALPFLFVFMMVVFFHELGHFSVGRYVGITARVFSIGMGREIFGRTDSKGTRWKVGWLPLGGYVQFLGEGDPITAEAQANGANPDDGRFDRKGVWPRIAVVAAGPIANFILAIVIFAFTFMVFGTQIAQPKIDKVLAGSPAQEAGFVVGDIIYAVEGAPVRRFGDVQQVITTSPGETLAIEVERAGERRTLYATPKSETITDEFGNSFNGGRLGIVMSPAGLVTVERHGLFESVGMAVSQTGFITWTTLKYIGQIIVGRQDADQLGGPIRIAQMSGQMASWGFSALLGLTAILSISLGLINLFPIPILDGGHLLYYLIEAARGQPLSERAQSYGMRVGGLCLVALMVFVTFNDLSHLGLFAGD